MSNKELNITQEDAKFFKEELVRQRNNIFRVMNDYYDMLHDLDEEISRYNDYIKKGDMKA